MSIILNQQFTNMKKKNKNKKVKNSYMGVGMMPMGYMDGGKSKIKPGESVDGIDVDTNVKNPNATMRGVGAATQGTKFFNN